MSGRTLTKLIESVIGGQSEQDDLLEEVAPPETPVNVVSLDTTQVEKIASVLEEIALKGLENILEKEAMAKCGSCGKSCKQSHRDCPSCGAAMAKQAASKAVKPPPGTNDGTMLSGTSGTQHTSTKSSPPMKSAPTGKVENNSKERPGGTASVDTSSTQKGTHHSALASNEAAINASPTLKEKEVAPALSAVLQNAGKGSNHRKMQKVAGHDPEAIRAEIAKRLAAKESTNA